MRGYGVTGNSVRARLKHKRPPNKKYVTLICHFLSIFLLYVLYKNVENT